MSEDQASMYLPKKLKEQLVERAKAEGFDVGRGRNSKLAAFIEKMLMDREQPTKSELLQNLGPMLHSTVVELGQLENSQRQLVNKLLKLLLAEWKEN